MMNQTKGSPFDRIVAAVFKRWESFDATRILANIFDSKCRIIQEIIKHKGSNEFKMPRSGNSHKDDKGSWQIELVRDEASEIVDLMSVDPPID
jgi:hypothetical protein